MLRLNHFSVIILIVLKFIFLGPNLIMKQLFPLNETNSVKKKTKSTLFKHKGLN